MRVANGVDGPGRIEIVGRKDARAAAAIDAYQDMARRRIDSRRVFLLGATMRLSEPAGALEGRIIGIDPARGYSSQIQGVSTKIYANRLNFAVATLVKEKLEAQGATVVFTLSSVKDDKTASQRVKILNDGKVELAVRIECNSVKNEDTRGAMAWVPEKHDKKADCDKLASSVLSAYVDATSLPLREVGGDSIVNKSDETFLNNTDAPVCTLFLGHNNTEFQQTMAQGIVNGILKYLGVNQ